MKKISLLFLMLLTGIIVAEAQPKGYKNLKDTSSFIKKFDDKARTITTNEADFVQEKYVSVMTDKAISKGKFYYKKSNQMRWETTEPQSHIIVLNNGKMIMKEKGKVKTYDASSNKMFKGLNDMMLTTASGNMLNSKEYKHSLFENEKYFLIQLTPVAATTRKFVKVIEVTVEKGDYTVSQIKMIEPSEDYTRIEFSNKKINQPIGDDLFILK
ncbi:MAG TPA: outer membrane lipoprotein carrier protein LolA [Cytophagaceae bacterium]|jgi:outer membrane lipoprotein-sorting protein|nr:outer membrane lipoprotein carrier protein LolA [Cytophagaceae bacterium]